VNKSLRQYLQVGQQLLLVLPLAKRQVWGEAADAAMDQLASSVQVGKALNRAA